MYCVYIYVLYLMEQNRCASNPWGYAGGYAEGLCRGYADGLCAFVLASHRRQFKYFPNRGLRPNRVLIVNQRGSREKLTQSVQRTRVPPARNRKGPFEKSSRILIQVNI